MLLVCSGAAPSGLRTDHGLLYLQDYAGGSYNNIGVNGWGQWDTSNVGYLHVEVAGQ